MLRILHAPLLDCARRLPCGRQPGRCGPGRRPGGDGRAHPRRAGATRRSKPRTVLRV